MIQLFGKMHKLIFFILSFLIIFPSFAHVSERALVLLLPTDIYIPAGISVLILTILLTYLIPIFLKNIFKKFIVFNFDLLNLNIDKSLDNLQKTFSILSFVFIVTLIFFGWYGSRDPLSNPLSLFIWTVWFIGFPILQIIFGNFWHFTNPWIGIIRFLKLENGYFKLPQNFYYFPAVLGFTIFALFMLVHIAPNDPYILGNAVLIYLFVNFLFIYLFGRDWLQRGECFTIFFSFLSKMSLFWIEKNKIIFGFWGARLTEINSLPVSFCIFISTVLATLSFDGLNETFWWFKIINVNPLEFHGRSSVIFENSVGLLLFVILLFTIFSSIIFLGLLFAGKQKETLSIIGIQSISLLPIALGYHVAHYLTSFIVDIQYVLSTITDPFSNGSDYFGFGVIYQTTGFFNTIETVNLIWIIQGSAIVIGHVWAVLLSHKICYQYFNSNIKIFLSQIPISIFMICYTFLGLWILSSPIAA